MRGVGVGMAKLPYMQFYPGDWLLDTHVLSPATRGIWIDILSLMWREEPRTGTLEYTVPGWCKRLRCTDADLRTAVLEMEMENVCKIVKDEGKDFVRFTSRRIARDEKLRKANRLYVANHRSKAPCKVVVHAVQDVSKGENQNQSHISESEIRSQKSYSEEEKKEKTTLSSSSELDDMPPPRNYRADAREVLAFLNAKTGRQYRPVESTIAMIMARLKGQNLETEVDVQTCKSLIAKKVRDWNTDEKMAKYLRPETLFNRTKFESYLGELNLCAVQNVTKPCSMKQPAAPVDGDLLPSL